MSLVGTALLGVQGLLGVAELAAGGSVLAGALLVGALASHLRAGDEPSEMVPAAVLLVLAIAVVLNNAGVVA